MTTPDRVFIITNGAYSDYRIESVWSTREAAEAHRLKGEEIEEWLLNTTEERTVVEWRASLHAGGEIRVGDRPIETASPGETFVHDGGYLSGKGVWYGQGYGPSPEHARKSLADALAKAKAEQLEHGAQ